MNIKHSKTTKLKRFRFFPESFWNIVWGWPMIILYLSLIYPFAILYLSLCDPWKKDSSKDNFDND